MREVNKIICLIKTTTTDAKTVLLNYESADWGIPLFINIALPSDPNSDIQEIQAKVAAQLSISPESLTIKFDRIDSRMHTSVKKETLDKEKANKYDHLNALLNAQI